MDKTRTRKALLFMNLEFSELLAVLKNELGLEEKG
jgi:hypothetical protein